MTTTGSAARPLNGNVNLPVVAMGALATPEGLWMQSQHSMGIARLLIHEGRPAALVATACRGAVEYACRAALRALGLAFEDDLEQAFQSLDVPAELLWEIEAASSCRERMAATERLLSWTAGQMRRLSPERRWVV